MTTSIMLCSRQHFVMLKQKNVMLERHVIGGRLHVSHRVEKKMWHWFSIKKRSSSALTSLGLYPDITSATRAAGGWYGQVELWMGRTARNRVGKRTQGGGGRAACNVRAFLPWVQFAPKGPEFSTLRWRCR